MNLSRGRMMYDNRISSFLIILLVFTFSCTHEPLLEKVNPNNSAVTVSATCLGCPTAPICGVVDDITVIAATTYSVCPPQPTGQGSFVLDQNNCMIWTPSPTANQIITTCLVACNGFECDTTLITIFPPLPVDTTATGTPCDPAVVYFEKDVLPILTSNCAYSGCHNAASAKDGIVLDNYANVIRTGKIKVGNPNKSELYEVITETDLKDVMPPPPSPKLSNEQIQTIAKWITQGAKNEKCDENPSGCMTDNISYASYVRPALAACTTCHKTGNAGGNINLDSYAGVKSAAESGRLYGAISWANGYKVMPQGGSQIPDCTIKKIKSWIDAGSPNN
jgi:mono/diheme cytochrome c family protein